MILFRLLIDLILLSFVGLVIPYFIERLILWKTLTKTWKETNKPIMLINAITIILLPLLINSIIINVGGYHFQAPFEVFSNASDRLFALCIKIFMLCVMFATMLVFPILKSFYKNIKWVKILLVSYVVFVPIWYVLSFIYLIIVCWIFIM